MNWVKISELEKCQKLLDEEIKMMQAFLRKLSESYKLSANSYIL